MPQRTGATGVCGCPAALAVCRALPPLVGNDSRRPNCVGGRWSAAIPAGRTVLCGRRPGLPRLVRNPRHRATVPRAPAVDPGPLTKTRGLHEVDRPGGRIRHAADPVPPVSENSTRPPGLILPRHCHDQPTASQHSEPTRCSPPIKLSQCQPDRGRMTPRGPATDAGIRLGRGYFDPPPEPPPPLPFEELSPPLEPLESASAAFLYESLR